MRRKLRLVPALIILLAATAAAQETPDPWAALRRLEGSWTGTGTGFGTAAPVRHTWQFVLGGRFLRLETVSGENVDARSDVGYVSYDTDHGRLVFRQFFSEGYVNTYDVQLSPEDSDRIVFEYREAESAGGLKARLILQFETDDRYEMVLELASGEKDFAPCQTMEMNRQ